MPISISISIGDASVPRVVDAMAAHFRYQDQILNETGEMTPNPENKRAFIKRSLANWMKDIVAGYEGEVAARTARQEAQQSAGNLDVT